MSCNVFANNDEIACKAGAGKVIAAFPDVCLSPPSPPAGPIPVPYPDSSFAKDTKKGSKSVKIKNKEVMLKDQSFYKSSPLGDEAATRSFGSGVVTHVITGKTYFVMWSLDVKFEGLNVPRHIDPTTSNHSSIIGNALVPMVNLAMMALGWFRRMRGKCGCCGQDPHAASGTPVTMEDWYTTPQGSTPSSKLQSGFTTKAGPVRPALEVLRHAKDKKKRSPPCTCDGKSLPQPPCNQFYSNVSKADRQKIDSDWKAESKKGDGPGTIRHRIGAKRGEQVNHLTPKAAGGCPTSPRNLQAHEKLCGVCKDLDREFGSLQDAVMQP
jgi:Domain of unknown function (DUF4150)